METQEDYLERLERAKKRVKELKDFYNHVKAYILVNIFLLFLRGGFWDFIGVNGEALEVNFAHWLDLNFLLTPILWGIGLAIHGIYAHRYKFKFMKDWEDRQIKRYMEEDSRELDKYK